MPPSQSFDLSRNGRHGSIEEREILNLSPSPERFGVISGCAFLHCKKGTKADLNTVLQQPCRFRRPEDVRAHDDTSHVAQAGSTARLGGRQNRIQPLLGSFRLPSSWTRRARGRLCAGKSAIGFQTKIVMCLIRSFRTERRARIDRGERDIEFQPWALRIRRDFGMCISTL